MFGYRKNVASQGIGFVMASTTTFIGVAGLTVAVKYSIDGAAQQSGGGSVSDLGGGQYWYAMTQAETNGKMISFLFSAALSVTQEKTIVTTAADPTDSVRFGLTAIPNATAGATNGLPLSADSSGNAGLSATTNNAIADALLDRSNAIETAITPRLALRYIASATSGVLSGAGGTTITIKGTAVATTRITATVDADGNRSAIVLG